ncbi:sialidase-1-like [Anneissia japonica]|uniref:sialidase-1-like n=1 Tax=Anneissia japonica TaxID=1529436 RepID=UPI0014254DDC|nr:sialidase-1-like [Anneissia japonica]
MSYYRLQTIDEQEDMNNDFQGYLHNDVETTRVETITRRRPRRCGRKCRVCCRFFFSFTTVVILSIATWILIAVYKKRPMIIYQHTLWSSGDNGVNTYRIPLLIATPKGTLVAAAEARKTSSKDDGQKYLVIRRSIDQGWTWQSETKLLTDERYTDCLIHLGALLVNSRNGSIGLFYSICENQHDSCHIFTLMFKSSFDDGYSWEKAINVSHQIGPGVFTIGPGYAIEKKYPPFIGRLIVCGHGNTQYGETFCLLSDDNGETWRKGGIMRSIPYGSDSSYRDFFPDESQVVELPDGSIFAIIRNERHYKCFCRITALSFDGGESFASDSIRLVKKLPDSAVSAGLLWHGGQLIYSSPGGRILRQTLTLKRSDDYGVSWPKSTVLWPLFSSYSAMTSFSNSTSEYIYLVYEKGYLWGYSSIEFMIIDLSMLN